MDLNFDFFTIDPEFSKPGKGKVLISGPFLGDEYFKRSVILLTEHNAKGTVGFVLNKPVEARINEVIKDFPDIDIALSVGGPVSTDTVHYIHSMGDKIPGSIKVYGNISWGGDFDIVKSLLSSGLADGDSIRFFIGYSGWAPGQLEQEIETNSWVIADMDPARVMAIQAEGIWKDALSRLGNKYKLWTGFPESPDMN